MTTDRAVMQQALTAIESDDQLGLIRAALNLRLALAQPVPDVAAVMDPTFAQIDAIRKAVDAEYEPILDKLQREHDSALNERNFARQDFELATARIAELEQGQDALDAKRYRFLRAQPIDGEPGQPVIAMPNGMRSGYYLNEETADHAIDTSIRAAMGTQPAPTSGELEPVVPADSKMIAAPAVVDASHRHHTQCTRYNNNCGAVHPSNCPECPFRKGAQP